LKGENLGVNKVEGTMLPTILTLRNKRLRLHNLQMVLPPGRKTLPSKTRTRWKTRFVQDGELPTNNLLTKPEKIVPNTDMSRSKITRYSLIIDLYLHTREIIACCMDRDLKNRTSMSY
jgi:hypothetical protein